MIPHKVGRNKDFALRIINHTWLLPLLLFLLLVLGYPFLNNIIYSISDVDFASVRNPTISGIDNYKEVLFSPAFWESFWFSLRFGLTAAVLEVFLGLVLSIYLAPILRRFRIFMALVVLPLMVAPVLIGIMYRLMLNEFVGIIPQYLSLFNIKASLLNPPLVYLTIVLIEVLQWTPFAILILFAGLQYIPTELLEAGVMDGANKFLLLRYITLPLLLPYIAITAFIRFVDSFRVFDHIFVLTGGGPGRLTTSVSIYIYKAFFQQANIGPAVAAAMVVLFFSLVPLVISMRYFKKENA